MQVLDAITDQDAFSEKLVQARQSALLLDYDGTLAPFRVERDRAFPYPKVRETLRRIAALGNTRLAIVSGRPVRELPPLLGFEGLGFERHRPEIWGCHGWERLLPDGTYHRARPDKRSLEGLALAYGSICALACSRLGRWFPIEKRVERKPVGLALHWRGCGAAVIEEIHESVTQHWKGYARETGLELIEIEEGVELRVPGRTKADAVETIVDEEGKEAAVAYLGDDLTDEEAFQALKGKGLTVLVRPDPRPSAADLWIRPPHELCDFLWLWEGLRDRQELMA
ncbi:MAG: trehalose-phosphatase [Gammaproteobacteria bacterium]